MLYDIKNDTNAVLLISTQKSKISFISIQNYAIIGIYYIVVRVCILNFY